VYRLLFIVRLLQGTDSTSKRGQFRGAGHSRYAEHHSGRPLLTPDEVRNLPQNRELLFLAGLRPVLADKLRYYADGEFAGLFERR
jgi:type IV secretion system protein VirD4